MLYRTYFNLDYDVLDFEEARLYLIEDDMTPFLKNDLPEETKNKIESITWILKTENSGQIDLVTTSKMSDKELKTISEWVSGQNSDGLGEGFEQQDFAHYSVLEMEDNDDEFYSNDDYVMASFDWRSNDYDFTLINTDN